MRVFKTKTTKQNLCDFCQLEQPMCPKANHIKFGNGIGNDNIIECSEYLGKSYPNNDPIEIAPEYGIIKKASKALGEGNE